MICFKFIQLKTITLWAFNMMQWFVNIYNIIRFVTHRRHWTRMTWYSTMWHRKKIMKKIVSIWMEFKIFWRKQKLKRGKDRHRRWWRWRRWCWWDLYYWLTFNDSLGGLLIVFGSWLAKAFVTVMECVKNKRVKVKSRNHRNMIFISFKTAKTIWRRPTWNHNSSVRLIIKTCEHE